MVRLQTLTAFCLRPFGRRGGANFRGVVGKGGSSWVRFLGEAGCSLDGARPKASVEEGMNGLQMFFGILKTVRRVFLIACDFFSVSGELRMLLQK